MGAPPEAGGGLEAPTPRELRIVETRAPRGLRLIGELSSENAETLMEALASDGEAGGDLTLDLEGVTFIDTMGLHVIAQAAMQRDGRGRLVLESASPWIRRVFVLAGIDAIPNVELRRGQS